MVMLEVGRSSPGLPAECQVISAKKGPPSRKRSSSCTKLDALLSVRGGKNSTEKKGVSCEAEYWRILSTSGTCDKSRSSPGEGLARWSNLLVLLVPPLLSALVLLLLSLDADKVVVVVFDEWVMVVLEVLVV